MYSSQLLLVFVEISLHFVCSKNEKCRCSFIKYVRQTSFYYYQKEGVDIVCIGNKVALERARLPRTRPLISARIKTLNLFPVNCEIVDDQNENVINDDVNIMNT